MVGVCICSPALPCPWPCHAISLCLLLAAPAPASFNGGRLLPTAMDGWAASACVCMGLAGPGGDAPAREKVQALAWQLAVIAGDSLMIGSFAYYSVLMADD